MRIGQYDSWNERDNITAALPGYEKIIDLAHASSMPNEPNDCWCFAKDALVEFGCSPVQIAQLMSDTKDIRQLHECENLDSAVHVLRAFLGRCAYRARLHLHYPIYTRIAEECIGTGITVIGPDELGLTDEQYAALERELSTPKGALSKNGSNLVASHPNEFPTCNLLLSMLTPILSQISGYKTEVIENELARSAFAQRVVNGPEDNDVQKVLHQDTWCDAWKLWYFPRDVRAGEGPFRFARNSHGLSAARLRFTRDFATAGKTWEPWRSYGHDEGSWRASEAELGMMGTESEDITCSAGTLVIANVFGFHARGEATETRERIALHASVRLNPWTT